MIFYKNKFFYLFCGIGFSMLKQKKEKKDHSGKHDFYTGLGQKIHCSFSNLPAEYELILRKTFFLKKMQEEKQNVKSIIVEDQINFPDDYLNNLNKLEIKVSFPGSQKNAYIFTEKKIVFEEISFCKKSIVDEFRSSCSIDKIDKEIFEKICKFIELEKKKEEQIEKINQKIEKKIKNMLAEIFPIRNKENILDIPVGQKSLEDFLPIIKKYRELVLELKKTYIFIEKEKNKFFIVKVLNILKQYCGKICFFSAEITPDFVLDLDNNIKNLEDFFQKDNFFSFCDHLFLFSTKRKLYKDLSFKVQETALRKTESYAIFRNMMKVYFKNAETKFFSYRDIIKDLLEKNKRNKDFFVEGMGLIKIEKEMKEKIKNIINIQEKILQTSKFFLSKKADDLFRLDLDDWFLQLENFKSIVPELFGDEFINETKIKTKIIQFTIEKEIKQIFSTNLEENIKSFFVFLEEEEKKILEKKQELLNFNFEEPTDPDFYQKNLKENFLTKNTKENYNKIGLLIKELKEILDSLEKIMTISKTKVKNLHKPNISLQKKNNDFFQIFFDFNQETNCIRQKKQKFCEIVIEVKKIQKDLRD